MEITFSSSALPCVMVLLAIRARELPFVQTHMGKILRGQYLTEQEFEGPTPLLSDCNPGPHDYLGISQSYHPVLSSEDYRPLNQI